MEKCEYCGQALTGLLVGTGTGYEHRDCWEVGHPPENAPAEHHLKPTTMEGIKRLAKRIRRQLGWQHAKALELAAQRAGHASFHDARQALTGQID